MTHTSRAFAHRSTFKFSALCALLLPIACGGTMPDDPSMDAADSAPADELTARERRLARLARRFRPRTPVTPPPSSAGSGGAAGAASSNGGAPSAGSGTTPASNAGSASGGAPGTTPPSNAGSASGGAPGTTPPSNAGSASGGAPSSGGTPGQAPGSADVPRNLRSPLGTNLGGIFDYASEWPFVDAMKVSRDWISGTAGVWNDGRAIDVDENGWVRSLAPGQIVRTLIYMNLDTPIPVGRYVVLYDGKGTLQYAAGARRDAAASTPGRDVIDVDRRGIELDITAVDAGDPLRNIRVLMPGGACSNDSHTWCASDATCGGGSARCVSFEQSYATQVFHPTFLDRIETYQSLRFMDWGATNDSAQRTWAERPKPADARYSVKGAPVEVMVDLANRLGADPWFTVPHLADDAYVSEYAALVRRRLAPGRKVYVEHSNEVWNGQFAQAGYARDRGLALGLSSNAFQAQLWYHSRRSVQIFDIFERQFGGTDRLVRVLATQAGNDWTSSEVLDFENAAAHADALAIAPYFGHVFGSPDQTARVSRMTADAVIDEIESSVLPEVVSRIKAHAAIARARGVRLIAYEGGQHLAGIGGAENDATLNALFDAVNRSPRMKGVYLRYLDAWRANGGQLFAHYVNCGSYSKWGRWGALEYLDQPVAQAPKYDALQSFIGQNPVWW